MSQYNTNIPAPPWSASMSMQASIILDQPGNVSFTNLDEISGRVVVRCSKSVDISTIVVKLEGESRTRLMSSGGPDGERPKPQLEYHKILYKVQTVFPPADVLEGRAGGKNAYTLPPGSHEYPWKFKLPFNNACHTQKSVIASSPLASLGLEAPKAATNHAHKTLPPTLSGFPGEAEIRYFVKATVGRHSFFKENPRAYAPFNFFPIEPPRKPPTGSQVYARQKHAFAPFPEAPMKEKMKSIFGKKSNEPSPLAGDAPFISVDARLPEPAVLTCNQDIPLSILIKRLNASSDPIYLQSLQISLNASTKIRAHDVFRTEQNSWIIMSKSNMGMLIGSNSDAEGTEVPISDSLWRGQILPNTVAPSFETCNIVRSYYLDIRVGLSCSGSSGSTGKISKASMQRTAQNVVLPLRLETQVYSGIAPPAEVLERMAEARANKPAASNAANAANAASAPNTPHAANTQAMDEKLKTEGRQSSVAGPSSSVPPTPSQPYAPEKPARPGQPVPPQEPDFGDAPPSYEDAIASDMPSVDAPRPDYAPPPTGDDQLLGRDEKKGWVDYREVDDGNKSSAETQIVHIRVKEARTNRSRGTRDLLAPGDTAPPHTSPCRIPKRLCRLFLILLRTTAIMTNALVGDVYEKIIQEVVDASKNDFEESGVGQGTLNELQQVSANQSSCFSCLPFFSISFLRTMDVPDTTSTTVASATRQSGKAGCRKTAMLVADRYLRKQAAGRRNRRQQPDSKAKRGFEDRGRRAEWQHKLSQRGVAHMPWDPKPAPPAPQQPPPQQQQPVQQQHPQHQQQQQQQINHNVGMPPANPNGMPNVSYPGYENSVPAPSNGAPRVKTEPGMEQQQQAPQQQYHGLPSMNNYSQVNGGQGGGAARAQQLVEQQFGPQATAGFQRGGLALPGQQQAKPPQGLQLPPNQTQQMQQQYQQQQQQAMQQQQQRQQQQLNQQQQNPQIKVENNNPSATQGQYQQQPAPNYSQTDGADDALDEWRAMLAERRALVAGQTERADHMMRERIAALSDDLQSGLMLPLDEQKGRLQARSRKAAALKSKRAAGLQGTASASAPPAIAQLDGDAADDEDDEDAINSDLDDPEDDTNQINDDDDDNGDSILCTYDKVQRVKNKWKCTLKDGVLNANGKEWLFHKGNGEFEW
ncbi:hypothetical protein Q7P37_004746 [Cladosporium fusiforme]